MWASVREVEGNFIFTRIRAQVNAVQILITHKYFSGVGVNFQLGFTLASGSAVMMSSGYEGSQLIRLFSARWVDQITHLFAA